MRRSENRGEPRETFASNSRDLQDFEIFFFFFFFLSPLSLFLSFSPYSFRPTVAQHPHLRPRAFFTSVSRPFISSSRSLSRHRWESSTIEMAKRLPFFPRAWFTDLSCSSRAFFLLHPCETSNLGQI